MKWSVIKAKLKNIAERLVMLLVLCVVLWMSFVLMRGCEDTSRVHMQLSVEDDIVVTPQEVKMCDTPLTIEDSVFTFIFECRIEHPHIVMAQCVEESGNFTSRSFLEGNNCTGMKVPHRRPTLCNGALLGHAKFTSWQDCIKDYAIWQGLYCAGKTESEYFAYLDRVYAEKKEYSKRLKRIISERGF